MSTVINPYTGRSIKVGSPKFKQLESDAMLINIQSARKPRNRRSGKTSKRSKKSTKKKCYKSIAQAIDVSYSGSRTAGWASQSPRKGRERKATSKKCGSKCFLMPGEQKFPICPKRSCKISCKGLLSAKIRAKQYKYNKVASKSEALMRKYKC